MQAQAGTPLSALQELGGWDSSETVRLYAHLSAEHLARHAETIARPRMVSTPVKPKAKVVAFSKEGGDATEARRVTQIWHNRLVFVSPTRCKCLKNWRARRDSNSRPPGS